MTTANPTYSCWSLLPAPEPRTVSPPANYFYENVAKHLIKDIVRLMLNGIAIDLTKVSELEAMLDEQLAKVESELAYNPYIQQFLELTYTKELEAYKAERATKLRTIDYYIKPFDHKNMHHRSYFMHFFSQSQGFKGPTDEIHPGISKWDANTVKKLTKQYPLLTKLLNGTLTDAHPLVKQAITLLAQHKCDIYNQKFLEQIANPSCPYPKFNPSSSQQKQALFTMLDIESESTSATTGDASFNRAEIERINKESDDPHIIHLTQCFIDHSYAAIVRNNFIEAFYRYTVDGRLYGQLKLFGTKTFRLTSNKPNLLNMPSTGSIFAKPIKQCLIAPPNKVIYAIDYGALTSCFS